MSLPGEGFDAFGSGLGLPLPGGLWYEERLLGAGGGIEERLLKKVFFLAFLAAGP